MFISNSRKFIFIHLEKCAGTSIEVALSRTLQWNDILIGSTKEGEAMQDSYKKLFGLEKHSTAREVKEVVGDVIWNEYFTFGTVRNPYSLAVSQYTYSLQHLLAATQRLKMKPLIEGSLPNLNHYNTWPYTYPGLQALLATGGVNSKFGDFIRSSKLTGWEGVNSQRARLGNGQGELIVDQVLKIEALDGLWPGLCERLNLSAIPLGRVNPSTDGTMDFRYFYRNPQDQAFVYEKFREDFELFDYPRDL
jgi:hypothetical protein